MVFGFFRRLRRKVFFVLLLLALVIFLKANYPGFGQRVGRWITGLENTRVAQAFSQVVSSLSDGEVISRAMEVFHEGLQG